MKPSTPARRAPNGVVSAKPILLRLLPDELAQVKEMAAHGDRSMASVCRLAVKRGLAEYRRDPLALTKLS